jgi:hypothetical protein
LHLLLQFGSKCLFASRLIQFSFSFVSQVQLMGCVNMPLGKMLTTPRFVQLRDLAEAAISKGQGRDGTLQWREQQLSGWPLTALASVANF